jgi:4'-phosphopantetheinyl transferase
MSAGVDRSNVRVSSSITQYVCGRDHEVTYRMARHIGRIALCRRGGGCRSRPASGGSHAQRSHAGRFATRLASETTSPHRYRRLPPPLVMRPGNNTPELRSGTIGVWSLTLSVTRERLDELHASLSSDERQRALRFGHAVFRDRYVAARGQLRELLGAFLCVAPPAVRFRYNEFGKPAIASPRRGRFLQFNLSHSMDQALVGVSDSRIGVDIEFVRPLPEMEAIRRRFSGEDGPEGPLTSPGSRDTVDFFRWWARKEAYLKAIGTGLRPPVEQWDANRWSLIDVEPALGFVGAVAHEGSNDAA